MSVPLHDIGKVGIRDNILLKQGRLTKEEFEIMKTHTTLGYEAIMNVGRKLKNSSFLEYAADVAYTHHEKYDGTGYPRGLKGDDIPLIGRLMAVADVYDALISKRIYKDPMTHDEAIEIIKSGRGSHFDPKIVDCALDLENTFQNIAQTYADFDPTMTIFDHDKMVELKNDGLLKKILIVEDSRIVRLIMKNQLLAIGFDVDEAENGEVGLKIATKNDYDLILLDIEMPKMNGYQMVTALKTVKELPIIIAMTAADYSITYGELKTFGIEGLILKPVDFNRLASKYTEILREQGKLEY
jgi:putative two-component system response regulator